MTTDEIKSLIEDTVNLQIENIIPVGTIIMSLVNFDVFCQVSGDISSIKWDAKISKWAPADGREVEKSQYQKATGKKTLPDLRGVFLRGLNEFDSRSQTSVSLEHADPENNRKPGSFQNQSTHLENIYLSGYDAACQVIKFNNGIQLGSTVLNPPAKTVDNNETRPKNVAVYYYIKIN